jgi:hypothetical protein
MTLNTAQQTFFNKVISLNFSKILLTGEAGCGKTYVLTQALAELHRQGVKVLLCAPTHLARVNLQAKMPDDVRHEMPTSTVASLLSRHGFNTGDGSTGFTRPKADRVANWQVIAIDEVSMLGKVEYDVLKETGAKIIFTGDFAQLPTVMQRKSMMQDDSDLEQFHLDEQMRQHGVIHQVAEANREAVYFPEESMSDDTGSVTVHKSNSEMIERMISDILADERGVNAHDQYRFITQTNKSVHEVGAFVRDMVIAHEMGAQTAKNAFAKGELLLSYETTPACYNGEVVKVLEVVEDPNNMSTQRFPWTSYRLLIEGNRGECYVQAIDPKQYHLVDEMIEDLQEKLKYAQKQRAFDQVKSYAAEIEHIKFYWTKLLYPFAITCHKSQGMTIESVYVDTNSFAKASNKRALLYVGLSRASKALHTVQVEKPRWKIVREINDRYRAAKERYEVLFNEPAYKVRVRTGLPAKTPEQKLTLAEYMEALIADGEQAAEAGETTISQIITPAILATAFAAEPTLEPIAF